MTWALSSVPFTLTMLEGLEVMPAKLGLPPGPCT